MKMFASLITLLALSAQPVFAEDTAVYASEQSQEEVSQVFETEEGPLTINELMQLQGAPPSMDAMSVDPKKKKDNNNNGGNNNDQIVGAIIGGIIGAIGAAIIEKQYPDHNNNGRRQVTCFAKNRKGEVFRAHGKRNRARAVQARAVDKCYRESRFCKPLGCRAS